MKANFKTKEERSLSYQCYYCNHEAEKVRLVTFYTTDSEHDEPLCDTCYGEWLESLKG